MKKEFMSVDIYDIPEILKVQTRTYMSGDSFRSLWDDVPGVEAIELIDTNPTGDSLMLENTGAHRRLLKAIKPYVNETVALDWSDGYNEMYKITDTLLVVPPESRHISVPVPEKIRPMEKWEWTGVSYRCSKCGGRVPGCSLEVMTGKWKYCPECGSPIEVKTYKMESVARTYSDILNRDLNKELDHDMEVKK